MHTNSTCASHFAIGIHSQITALLLEQSPYAFKKLFSSNSSQSKLKIIDASSDAKGWKLKDKPEGLATTNLATLRTALANSVPTTSSSVLFIDSINHLLLVGHAESQVAAFVSDLKSYFSSIVLVSHLDSIPSSSFVSALESVATCIIEVVPSPKMPLLDVTGSFSILQKRKSGKVSRTVEHYHLPKTSDSLVFYTDAQVVKKESAIPQDNKLRSKMDQLTPEQEAARASVALPYAKARDSASQSVSGLPEHTLDVPVHGTVFVDPEDVDPDDLDDDLDDF